MAKCGRRWYKIKKNCLVIVFVHFSFLIILFSSALKYLFFTFSYSLSLFWNYIVRSRHPTKFSYFTSLANTPSNITTLYNFLFGNILLTQVKFSIFLTEILKIETKLDFLFKNCYKKRSIQKIFACGASLKHKNTII